jgi:hypothetical protein
MGGHHCMKRLETDTKPHICDIRNYIEDKLENNTRIVFLIQREPYAAAMLVEEVKNRAEGVFLWAALVVKELLRGLTNKDDISLLIKRL